jgi:hypothetical protein
MFLPRAPPTVRGENRGVAEMASTACIRMVKARVLRPAVGLALGMAALTSATTTQASVVMDALALAWDQTSSLVRTAYGHAPALVIGLGVLLAVPPLALGGLLVRRRRAMEDYAARLNRSQVGSQVGADSSDGMTWPVDATIDIEGQPGASFPIGREILRIGRNDDNDVVLDEPTVHRYHAVIQRTEHADIIVVDVSGSDGNGVTVNDQRVSRARLRNGDRISLGKAHLRFGARRA